MNKKGLARMSFSKKNSGGFMSVIFLLAIVSLISVAGYFVFTQKAVAPTYPKPPVPIMMASSSESIQIVGTTTPAQSPRALQVCPEQWIDNKMPMIIEPGQPRPVTQYFIYQGERHELVEFDMNWVNANCSLEPSVVY
ncbi:MAG: hypothetical protein WC791_03860 [Candidatus Paceibacterota bacterium]|jgi:hypothetical protein